MLRGLAVPPAIADSVPRALMVCQPPVTGTSDVLVSVRMHTYIQLNQFFYCIASLALFCLFEMVMEGINRTKYQEKSKQDAYYICRPVRSGCWVLKRFHWYANTTAKSHP